MQLAYSGIVVYIFLILFKMSFLELGHFGNTLHKLITQPAEKSSDNNFVGLFPSNYILPVIYDFYLNVEVIINYTAEELTSEH